MEFRYVLSSVRSSGWPFPVCICLCHYGLFWLVRLCGFFPFVSVQRSLLSLHSPREKMDSFNLNLSAPFSTHELTKDLSVQIQLSLIHLVYPVAVHMVEWEVDSGLLPGLP